MAERRMCDVCGVRPAVTTMKRIAPGEPPRTEYLCEVHAAQAREGRTPLGGRSSFGGAAASRRTIQRRVDNNLSRMVLEGSLNPGDKVVIGAEDGRLTFEVLQGASAVGASGQTEASEED